MITNSEDFKKARDIAEKISTGKVTDIKFAIESAETDIIDKDNIKGFYDYMGSLLLNTILNREQEVGKIGIDNALEGRRIIKDIINKP